MYLHLTNGDTTRVPDTGLPGRVVFWRDVLHEGPVPAGLSLADLSALRAKFIHERGWAPEADTVAMSFRERDAAVATYREYQEIVLWFEHDLYDQLQILQILDWFSRQDPAPNALSLICIDRHPEVRGFSGLGQLSPVQLARLFPTRKPVSKEQLALARRAWSAYRCATPESLRALCKENTSALPYLRPALHRLFQQFPSAVDGLSWTERQLLRALRDGANTIGKAFRDSQNAEEAPFLGDWCFATEYVMPLIEGPVKLIESPDAAVTLRGPGVPPEREFWSQPATITQVGRDTLEGARNRVALLGLDRWFGGHHCDGRDGGWLWDPEAGEIIAV